MSALFMFVRKASMSDVPAPPAGALCVHDGVLKRAPSSISDGF
ncbi:hypothetical protein [Castellaniella sp.]